jgi:hypothetical protein
MKNRIFQEPGKKIDPASVSADFCLIGEESIDSDVILD